MLFPLPYIDSYCFDEYRLPNEILLWEYSEEIKRFMERTYGTLWDHSNLDNLLMSRKANIHLSVAGIINEVSLSKIYKIAVISVVSIDIDTIATIYTRLNH